MELFGIEVHKAVHPLETFLSNNTNYRLKYQNRRKWEKISWTATFQRIYLKKTKPICYISWCRFVQVQCFSGCWPNFDGGRRSRDSMVVRFTSFFIVLKNMFTNNKDVNCLLKICIYTMQMHTDIFCCWTITFSNRMTLRFSKK